MTLQNPDDARALQAAVAKALHEHWLLYLVEGTVLVVLGALAVVIPPLATVAFTLFLGWLFLLSGVVGLAMTFWTRGAPGFWWSLVSAVLAIVVGGWIIASPAGGVVSLTLVLIVFFVMEGVASIMFAIEHRREFSGRWGWMLASGVIDLVLAAMIYTGLPGSAAWAIGLLVGINMMFGGVSLIAMALHARSEATANT